MLPPPEPVPVAVVVTVIVYEFASTYVSLCSLFNSAAGTPLTAVAFLKVTYEPSSAPCPVCVTVTVVELDAVVKGLIAGLPEPPSKVADTRTWRVLWGQW